ncbi:MAG TPA: tRNA pseudouridine(55) synthase TruB [Anaerolineaceae bacterium]|nr:tRNA pseudouridine(55) synthase TruB [Anaerolineaceae bacterium]HNZ01451.1 tRNA pseudouridine(55) synthase TruB [Anaerolineaceae bacterium]HOD43736.1 tRNA pseudouridine(55) synthase TruB [Anaerolineaceae bacterium]HOH20242.1 tRNA pseudouridine(55) synthase TruB [Anaerolineaceae bacterium]HQL38803.1 tRNA pseudouridine(55) synthase TruB [Anaerolineaceae bacterium]
MDSNYSDALNTVSGVLVIDKPVGLTSHDVVQVVRRGTNIRRAGHTGTLDPRASGVLVVLVGPAVRLSEYVSASDKRYQAVVELGVTTDTFDADGSVTSSAPVDVTEEQFSEALASFVGEIEQVPPPYSAVRVKGRRAYDLAREGEEVDLQPRKIQVYNLELLEWDPPEAVIDVSCSSGTYVRSLANDLGTKLGCGAHLVGLRRTKSGRFTLRDAVPLKKLREAFDNGTWQQYLIPSGEALSDWPALELTPEQLDEVRHGHRIPGTWEGKSWVRGMSDLGELVALLEFDTETSEWQPRKVFNS